MKNIGLATLKNFFGSKCSAMLNKLCAASSLISALGLSRIEPIEEFQNNPPASISS